MTDMVSSNVSELVSVAQMRALEQQAINEFGISALILMENAGRAVAEVILDEIKSGSLGESVVVLAGPGNNGGDGFVAARHLHNRGVGVRVVCVCERVKIKGDALVNFEICEKIELPIVYFNDDSADPWAVLDDADIVIDALLGTGSIGAPRGLIADAIEALNRRFITKVVAVDIPSGLNADNGTVDGVCVEADVTVTLGCAKIGLVTYPGAEFVGKLLVADISLPLDDAVQLESLVQVAGLDFLEPRRADANKGEFGHVGIVAGSVGMTGAAALCANGALRSGAGLVSVAVPESLNDILEVKLTEAMTVPVKEASGRCFGMCSFDAVVEFVNTRTIALIGPGLGRADETCSFVRELIGQLSRPAILDADALYAVSQDLSCLAGHELIITPHPGEMARLVNKSVAEVQSDRLNIARQFAEEHNVVVVLKGAGTVIASPDGSAFINRTGCNGMASGGTGDVLAGIIAGWYAQCKDLDSAAEIGVFIHGLAGEKAAARLGNESMLAGDLVESISEAMEDIRNAR